MKTKSFIESHTHGDLHTNRETAEKVEPPVDQGDLFDPVPAAHFNGKPPSQAHSETSKEAAAKIEIAASTLRAQVFNHLRGEEGGATDDEMQVSLAMNPSTQRPRRRELQLKGLVVDSGKKRKTRSNRQAVVWIVSAAGWLNRNPDLQRPAQRIWMPQK